MSNFIRKKVKSEYTLKSTHFFITSIVFLSGCSHQNATANTSNIIDMAEFGVISDDTCKIDNTLAIRKGLAEAEGKIAKFPQGVFCLNTPNSTIKVPNNVEIMGTGKDNTIIVWNAPKNTPAAPIVDIVGENVTLHDIGFRHNGQNYTDSNYFGENPWGGIALSIQGSNFTGYNLSVFNGFDNCIGISKMKNNLPVRGEPKNFYLRDIITYNCGIGEKKVGPTYIHGKNGAGIDNGSGSFGRIENVTDNGSSIGFISDIGAGANAKWRNLKSFNAQPDTKFPKNGSGYGVYVGDPDSTFEQVKIVNSGKSGIWIDAPAWNTQLNDVIITNANEHCLFIKGSLSAENIACSKSYPTQYADILIDTSAVAIDKLNIENLTITTNQKAPKIQQIGRKKLVGHISFSNVMDNKPVILSEANSISLNLGRVK